MSTAMALTATASDRALRLDACAPAAQAPSEFYQRALPGADRCVRAENGARGFCGPIALEDAAGSRSSWFPWTCLSVDAIESTAVRASMRVGDVWHDAGRWFAEVGIDRRQRPMAFGRPAAGPVAG